jgi:hypothetical protein
MAFTDGIVRLFSNDLAPLRVARGLGLLVLDLLAAVTSFRRPAHDLGSRAWPDQVAGVQPQTRPAGQRRQPGFAFALPIRLDLRLAKFLGPQR